MSQYGQQPGYLTRRSVALMAIMVLHGLAIYTFADGFARSRESYAQTIVQTRFIQRPRLIEPPPRSRLPANLKQFPPVQLIAPQIDINVPADPPPAPIQLTTTRTEDAPPTMPLGAAPTFSTRPRVISAPGGSDRYPAESVRAKEWGSPVITICISATGSVDSVQLAQSSGFPRLDQAAVGIGKEARFKPATRDGKPVPICLRYGIKFGIANT
jgi:protein TonB